MYVICFLVWYPLRSPVYIYGTNCFNHRFYSRFEYKGRPTTTSDWKRTSTGSSFLVCALNYIFLTNTILPKKLSLRRPPTRRIRDSAGGLAHRDSESHQPRRRQDRVPSQHAVPRSEHLPANLPPRRRRCLNPLLRHRQLHRPHHGHAHHVARHSDCHRLHSSSTYLTNIHSNAHQYSTTRNCQSYLDVLERYVA